MRRAVAAIAALVLVLATGAAGADAASVGAITTRIYSAGGTLTYAAADRTVSDLTVTTTGSPATLTSATVKVAGTTLSQLNGQSITLLLLDATTTPVRTISTTLATGTNLTIGTTASITVPISGTTPRSSVTAWAVMIAGVQVLPFGGTSTTRYVTVGNGTIPVAAWTETVVPPAAATDITVNSVTVTSNTTVQQCLTISITGASSTPTAWTLKLDFSQPPYYGIAPDEIQYANVQSTVGSVWTLGGKSHGGAWDAQQNNALLTNAQTVSIKVCQNNAGVAPNRTEAYTTSGAAVPYGTWSSNQACKSVTVTGNGTYPFYFGWSVSIDMTSAYTYLRTFDAAAPRSFAYTPDTVTPGFSGATTSYLVKNHRDDAIAGTGTYTAVLCANRY